VGSTVEAVLDQDSDEPFELIIVDNGSSDETETVLERYRDDERVRVIRLDPNRGPTPARNAGWRAARAPVVAFTDDDCVPDRGWLRAILAATDRGADVVMGRTVADPQQFASAGPFSHWVEVEESMPWFPTCNIAYRRDMLAELGGFDETFTARLGSSFGDDTDLGWRALEHGAEARFSPDAAVVHEVTDSDLRAWLRARQRRMGVPDVVARHPGLRVQLPRPWVYERSHPPALLGALGILWWLAGPTSLRRLLVALAALAPYVHFRVLGQGRRPVRGATTPAAVAGLLAGDVLEAAVTVRAAARARIVLI
jgi:GT2 family glycosyltransferase